MKTDFREPREKVGRPVHRLLQSSKQETDESGSEAQEGGSEDGKWTDWRHGMDGGRVRKAS